jgi:glucosamine kinase
MSGSTPSTERLVLGLDIGASWTRALLATTTGRRVGSARAAGANPAAHHADSVVQRVATAVSGALGTIDPAAVAGCVVGLAGASQYAADPAIAAVFDRTFQTAGLTCPVRVATDVAIAFAAGTAEPAGWVLLAGTGAIAAQIRDREPTALHGGYGWLLGDDGSGFWIGRQAVRSALSTLDGGGPVTELHRLVLERYLDGARPAEDDPPPRGADRGPVAALIREVNRRPPVALADLAPLVMQAYAAGDTEAEAIIREAAGQLVAILEVAAPAGDAPVVLAGGLLTSATPVHHLVASEIRRRWPGLAVRTATDGTAAAAWLAALPLLPSTADAAALHTHLMPA